MNYLKVIKIKIVLKNIKNKYKMRQKFFKKYL